MEDEFTAKMQVHRHFVSIDFFPALPDDKENEVEAYVNLDDWR